MRRPEARLQIDGADDSSGEQATSAAEPPVQREIPAAERMTVTATTVSPAETPPSAAVPGGGAPVERVDIAGVPFHRLTEAEVVAHVIASLESATGGRIVTPNVDILRCLWEDPKARELVLDADLIVADGVPLLWLARWTRGVRMSRVTGADLIFSVSQAAALAGRSIFVLGGPDGAAERAAENLAARYAGLRIAGSCCPPYGFEKQDDTLAEVVDAVVRTQPDIVFCGLGFPKQELFAETLRVHLPSTWFVGCGAAVLFASGDQSRAPLWIQRAGLEWLFRMAKEPKRLFKRYVVRDIPFLLRVLVPHYLRALRVRIRARLLHRSTPA